MGRNKSKTAGISEKVIRLLDIYSRLAKESYPSVQLLTDKLEVGERSVYRYLKIINLIDPIVYDDERKGYKFVSGNRIKKLIASEEDFILLLTVGETVTHLGEPFRRNFSHFMDTFLNLTKHQKSNEFPLMVKMPDAFEPERFGEYFNSILRCSHEMRSINIVYKSLHTKEVNERRVDPYGIVFYSGSWILVGYCHLRQSIRRFALDMIQDLKETWFTFKAQEDFVLKEHIAQSWGVYDGEPVDVTVRFAEDVANQITRKKQWHPSEKRKILPSGEVELTFTVAGVDEIKRWIYSWIPHVQIMKPAWFKKMANKEIQQTLKQQGIESRN
jgi:predicted DNA-binding transcriptional regulator YafY